MDKRQQLTAHLKNYNHTIEPELFEYIIDMYTHDFNKYLSLSPNYWTLHFFKTKKEVMACVHFGTDGYNFWETLEENYWYFHEDKFIEQGYESEEDIQGMDLSTICRILELDEFDELCEVVGEHVTINEFENDDFETYYIVQFN